MCDGSARFASESSTVSKPCALRVARDIALSAGTLASLRDTEALRRWLAAAILADLCDVVSTLVTPGSVLPGNARWGTVALGGGSALAGAALLAAADR